MPVTTYDELKTEIQNWLGDDDVPTLASKILETRRQSELKG